MKNPAHLKLSNVAMFHHDCEEAHDDLGAGSEKDLSLASFLSIVHALESVSQAVHTNHFFCNRKNFFILYFTAKNTKFPVTNTIGD